MIYCTWPQFVSWCPISAECRLRLTWKLGKSFLRLCKVCHTNSLFHMPRCEHHDHRLRRIWRWLTYSRVGPELGHHSAISAWWRYQMETFSALLAICAGNSPVTGEFPAQRPVTRSFDIFFDLRLNKRLRKQSWGCWFETLSRPLWRHFNGYINDQHNAACTVYDKLWIFSPEVLWQEMISNQAVCCSDNIIQNGWRNPVAAVNSFIYYVLILGSTVK